MMLKDFDEIFSFLIKKFSNKKCRSYQLNCPISGPDIKIFKKKKKKEKAYAQTQYVEKQSVQTITKRSEIKNVKQPKTK